MKKIINILSNISQDKLLHYVYSQWIFVGLLLILNIFLDKYVSSIISFFITTAILICKEYYDKKKKGCVELMDIHIGVISMILILLVLIL